MSIATKAQIKKALETKPVTDKWGYSSDEAAPLRNAIVNRLSLNRSLVGKGEYVISDADIDEYLALELDQLLAHRLGKGVRPWEIVNVTQKLDKKQAWIGVEYETGFDTGEEYRKIVNFVWNNFANSAIDAEGANSYPCELTFSPMNYDDFMDQTKNPMDRLYEFMKENKIVVNDKWGTEPVGGGCDCGDPDCDENYEYYDEDLQVGTHCNISTPAYRELKDYDGRENVTIVLNASLNSLSEENLNKFFNRIPYGGFYSRGGKHGNWIEGKLFNSTGDMKRWEKYKATIGRIAEVIEAVSAVMADPAKETYKDGKSLIVTNFAGYLSGRSKEVRLGFVDTYELINRIDSW